MMRDLTLPPRDTEYCDWAMRQLRKQRERRDDLDWARAGLTYTPHYPLPHLNIDWSAVTLAPLDTEH